MREAGEAAVIGSRSRDSDARVLLTEGIAEVHSARSHTAFYSGLLSVVVSNPFTETADREDPLATLDDGVTLLPHSDLAPPILSSDRECMGFSNRRLSVGC